MTPVILESPWQNGAAENVVYLRECMLDCFSRNEAPFASHALYTLALDDADDSERAKGITAGFVWHQFADYQVIYLDRGLSGGMREGILRFATLSRANRYVRFRSLLGGQELCFKNKTPQFLIDRADDYAKELTR